MSQLLASALWYAKNGWPVLPLAKGAKIPLVPRGLHDASTHEETIRAWWRKWPEANIGIATEPAGLVVVDVDTKNNGDATFEALRSELGPDPFDTLTSLTPSGGQHLVYATDGSKVSSGAHVLGQGIDLRAAGGYIVAPPSQIAGVEYSWESGYGPKDRTPLMWPDALAKKIVVRVTAAPLEESGKIPDGERNATLTSIAGSLRRRGLDYDEMLACLEVVNAKRCLPLLPLRDLELIAKSISRYEPDEAIGANIEPLESECGPLQAFDVFAQIHNTFDPIGSSMPFGIKQLDERLGGMTPGQVTVLAARPATGKTASMEHIIAHAALVGRVLCFTLEMSRTRILERMGARAMRMPLKDYRAAGRPMDDPDRWKKLDLLFVDRSNRITVEAIEREVSIARPKLVVIDHARHIAGWLPKDGKMRADLAPIAIMHGLTNIAEKYQTHVLLLSQVGRGADGKRPSLSDLRDSGGVEENADTVIFLHRPFQFGGSNNEPDDLTEFCVYKSRESGIFVAQVGWNGPLMSFRELHDLDEIIRAVRQGDKKGGKAA
jgi:putative DNA primase/helicase